eukprot:INCI7691.2.p1 GENE.INCI7691.2~~INCI7691.2.p1  ORF type:complete len:393 (+),score=80.53 INCI7691.2:195-1373(+)
MQAVREAAAAKSSDIREKYAIGKVIGQGTFAAVHLCTQKSDGKEWAVKVFDKTAMSAKEAVSLKSEINILRKVQHPNIVELHETFDTPTHYYLVMECMHGGELFDRIVQRLSYTESDAALVVANIVRALHHCHQLGIVHRDLKPENLLYATTDDDAPVKIADFGLAKLQSHASESMKTACGTPGYVAPEVLMRRGYTKAVDMWSTGVITYILLCGFPPFYEENNAALFSAIKAAAFDYPPEFWSQVSDEAKNFIDKLLVKDPKARLTTEQALEHPWIVAHVDPADRALYVPPEQRNASGENAIGKDGLPSQDTDDAANTPSNDPEADIGAVLRSQKSNEPHLATITELKKYNGIRKLRQGVQRVMIMHRLKRQKTKLANLAKKVVSVEPEFL